MLENLSNRLLGAIKAIKGQGKITEGNIQRATKEIRTALLEADVSYKVVKKFTDDIKKESIGRKIAIAVKPSQLFTKIVHEKLVELMGSKSEELHLKGNPSVIMLAGLQGSGKTTLAGKLALKLKKQNKEVLLIACDVYRLAAINQLEAIGETTGVEVYKEDSKDPVGIAKRGMKYAKENAKNVIIVDTAGRLNIDEDMMKEIKKIKSLFDEPETLFVVDSMLGQEASNIAKDFNDRLSFNGIVLTKMDSDTRGGAALSIRSITDKPIKFISTGEKLEDLDNFYPDRMANRILGMGDVLSFVEKAQEVFDEEQTRIIEKKIRKNTVDFDDIYKQIQQTKKLSNVKDLFKLLPGKLSKLKDQIQEKNLIRFESMIQSMTPYERKNPSCLTNNRKNRIAKGSGNNINDVNQLVKRFQHIKKHIKKMKNLNA